MEEYTLQIAIKKKAINELSGDEKRWMEAAVNAAKRAYAPYSHFQVGSAAILDDGEIIIGNNQENAAYPSGLCAERVALFSAGALHPECAIKAVAIVAIKEGVIQDQIAPCGACRQVLLETEQRYQQPIEILLFGRGGVTIINSATALLPLSFGKTALRGEEER